MEITLPMTYQ